MLDALEGRATATPPAGYVAQLFDGYSDHFEEDLLGQLFYRVPTLLTELLQERLGGGRRQLRVVDLGCGTGLSAQAVAGYAAKLVGVDLSAKMVEEAEKKGCYDTLAVADVVEYVQGMSEAVDLFLAADVLTYLGDLEPLFRVVAERLQEGGLFCFSTEHGESRGWQLRKTGRYGHHPDYVRELASIFGFQVLTSRQEKLRREREEWIAGDLYLLEK